MSTQYVTVYDKERRKTAVLQNACEIQVHEKLNGINTLYFSLPYNDPKIEHCQPYHYVEFENVRYRILPSDIQIREYGMISFNCEHVIATLIDKCMFGATVLGGVNVDTRTVINQILARQSDWRLGDCQLNGYYEYGFEQETLLNALFGVPSCFVEPYKWEYDTSVSPWKVHLRKIDTAAHPDVYLWSRKNITYLEVDTDITQVCTRLYPLGYGEGVNQLTIKDVNGGKPYLDAPKAVTDKYGIIERIWTDRQYEDAASLKAAAQRMLTELQEPYTSYRVGVDGLNDEELAALKPGAIVQVAQQEYGQRIKSYVTEVTRSYDGTPTISITIANKPQDAAAMIADLADRLRIESAYAQGATNLYAQSLQTNADDKTGAVISFYIPPEMRIVNKVMCKVKIEQFRAYSKATEGGGGSKQTSSGGGGGTIGSSSGGGGSTGTFEGGGGNTGTAAGGSGSTSVSTEAKNISDWGVVPGSWEHGLTVSTGYPKATNDVQGITAQNHIHTVPMASHKHNITIPAHSHSVQFPSHSHSVTIPSHSHTVNIPSHTHSLELRPHTHSVEIPSHTHGITAGIHRVGARPTSFQIIVNGTVRQTVSNTQGEYNITDYLTGTDGKIRRGTWHTLEIRPNSTAYCILDMFVQGFVQSRGDKTV